MHLKCKYEWWNAVLGIASVDMCMPSNFGESAYGTVFIIQLWSRVIYYVVQKGRLHVATYHRKL